METLPRLAAKPNGELWVGDVPDNPSVEIDMRLRWSCAAALVIGPGNGAVGAPVVLLDLPNRLVKVWEVIELRRGLLPSAGGLLRSLLVAMLGGSWTKIVGKVD